MKPAIDRRSPMPLWSQVSDDLRRRLDAGEFAERFPNDNELMNHYGVSRHTARDAVRRLQDAGLVVRERGRGTHVVTPGLEQPLGTLYSLYRSIEDQGFEQRSTVRFLEERTDAEAAGVLGLSSRARLVYLERVRFADGEPVAVDCSWLPAEVARPLLDVDFTRTALYTELQALCGVRPVSGWERLRPELPSPEQRRLLGLPARQPVFAIERVTSSADGPLEWRHSVIRGDTFAFVARWSGTATSAVSGMESLSVALP
ncbi:GntR family transcriptional regulator [Iamia majanohamensis]|uniref:GntR family transcriptional regulator n=1 Tax=Iamia majanohamensis TaxID=467976 RepID=A0AAE9Y4W6_9ACTN|nr:GntR family transcriptional regulator [Iamia majanohamensis]WCO66330.1 GntR family transcriptional regulator [Iamia majanohamensis]